MLILFLNTTTHEWFDFNGNPFSADMPAFAYNSVEQIGIFLKSETPNAGELGVQPLLWKNDILYSQTPNLAARLTVDSDYIHKIKGSLFTSVESGSGTIVASFSNTNLSLIPPSGTVRLFAADGSDEAVRYKQRESVEGNVYRFTVADGVSVKGSYAAGSAIDCDQSPYCSVGYLPSESQPANGQWGFVLPINSQRLRDEFDYSDKGYVDIKGLELMLYTVDADGNERPLQTFLLDTATIVNTLGSVGDAAEVPEPMKNEVAALVSSLIGNGLDVETQTDPATGITQFRIRLSTQSAANSEWSEWVSVGISAEQIAEIEQKLEGRLQSYVQNELANGAW